MRGRVDSRIAAARGRSARSCGRSRSRVSARGTSASANVDGREHDAQLGRVEHHRDEAACRSGARADRCALSTAGPPGANASLLTGAVATASTPPGLRIVYRAHDQRRTLRAPQPPESTPAGNDVRSEAARRRPARRPRARARRRPPLRPPPARCPPDPRPSARFGAAWESSNWVWRRLGGFGARHRGTEGARPHLTCGTCSCRSRSRRCRSRSGCRTPPSPPQPPCSSPLAFGSS